MRPILAGLGFLGGVAAILLVTSMFVSNRNTPTALGADNLLRLGIDRTLADIADNGPRLQYVGKNRGYLYVNHVGDDKNKGWYAFEAIAPGMSADCALLWRPAERVFSSECEPTRIFPADGEGLTSYEATANPNTNQVVVDLTPT